VKFDHSGVAPGLLTYRCGGSVGIAQATARTDFPFHRVAEGDDGTSSKHHHVSGGESDCQAVCLGDPLPLGVGLNSPRDQQVTSTGVFTEDLVSKKFG
jgi:hypothetical protein